MIDGVVVRGNEAVVEGQGGGDGKLLLCIGDQGMNWSSGLNAGMAFSATVKQEGDLLHFIRTCDGGKIEHHITVPFGGQWSDITETTRKDIAQLKIAQESGVVPRGRVIFREGALAVSATSCG